MSTTEKEKDSKNIERTGKKAGRAGDPISLYPLTPEEALRAILKVSAEKTGKDKKRQDR